MDVSNDILAFIPQRPPFVMIGTLMFADEKTATTKFTITAENIFCENGFFSEAGLLENIAQTMAAGTGYSAQKENKPVSVGYIGAVKNFEVFFLPKINDELFTEIVVTDEIFNMKNIKGKIMCDHLPVAACEMKIFINPNH